MGMFGSRFEAAYVPICLLDEELGQLVHIPACIQYAVVSTDEEVKRKLIRRRGTFSHVIIKLLPFNYFSRSLSSKLLYKGMRSY